MELDEADYRILQALQQDGRLAIKDIAKRANVSVPTVRARIDTFTRLGVIKQFTAVIDHQKLLGGITAFINLKGRLTDLNSISEELKKMDEVIEAYSIIGEHDLTIKVAVPDIQALEEFMKVKLSQIPGLEYTRSNLITNTVKERYDSSLQLGHGVRIHCHTCKREIKGDMVKVKSYGYDYFFCCTSCSSIFEKEREKLDQIKA